MKTVLFALIALALSACVTREARLYPTNAVAIPGGVITGTFEAHGTGHGVVVITLPTGEELGGEYSIVRGGIVGLFMADRGHGTASAFGHGVSITCDFENDNLSGHGSGSCHTSKGATYRLQY